MLQPLLIDDPARFTELVQSCGVDGHVAVALLVPAAGPGGRTKERSLGRVPGSDENALDALGRLLALEGVVDLRVNVRLRAYCDGLKVGESKFAVRVAPKSLEKPAGAPPSASDSTGAGGAVRAIRGVPRSEVGTPEAGAAGAHDDGPSARGPLPDLRAGLSDLHPGLQGQVQRRLEVIEAAVAALQASITLARFEEQIAGLEWRQRVQNDQVQEIDVRMDENMEVLHARLAKLESGVTRTEAVEDQVRACYLQLDERVDGLRELHDGVEKALQALAEAQAALTARAAELDRVVAGIADLMGRGRR